MREFSFSAANQVYFAPGAVSKLPELAGKLGARRALIATGPRVAALPSVSSVIKALEAAGVETKIFTDIEANPSLETADALAQEYRDMGAQVMIAIGGGSPMDAAKAAAVVASQGGKTAEFSAPGAITGEVAPVIAVPTTAGTGSEVTSFAVITDRQRELKISISSPYILPKYAVLDPELLSTMPPSVAAATGADALVHAVEAYISLAASPMTDALAEKAVSLIGGSIKRFTANRGDVQAASNMIVGSALAGMAFNQAKLGDVHAMSHPVSAHFDAAHGEANAVLLPTVLEFNALADSGKYEKIYSLLIGRTPRKFEPSMLPEAVRKLFESLGLPKGLGELGVDPTLIPELAKDAMLSGNIPVNPRTTAVEDIIKMYEKAL